MTRSLTLRLNGSELTTGVEFSLASIQVMMKWGGSLAGSLPRSQEGIWCQKLQSNVMAAVQIHAMHRTCVSTHFGFSMSCILQTVESQR